MTAFPDIPIPIRGYRRTLGVIVDQTMGVDGHIERSWVNRHIAHAFDISWPGLTPTQKGTLDAFMVTCRGRYLNDITFTDPFDSVSYTCRLDLDALEFQSTDPLIWTGSLRLIEVTGFKANKAAVATFPATIPTQQYQTGRAYRTELLAQEDNSEKRYEDYASPIRRWSVGGNALTTAQALALCEAWEGNGGPWAAFHFTPIGGTELDAHFVENSISCESISNDLWSCRTSVEELL